MPQNASRLENLRSIRYANIDMAFYTAFVALTTGAFIVKLVSHLHGSPVWIGILSAIPSLCGIFQLPGAIWGRRYSSYKKFVTPGWILWRVLYLPLIFVPLLILNDTIKLWIVAVCITASYAAVFIANPVFFEWLTELVPPTSRGWLFGRRNAIAAPISAVVGLAGGLIVDRMTTTSASGNGQVSPIAFTIVFGIAVALGLIGQFLFFSRMHDFQRAKVVRESFTQNIKAFTLTLQDRDFVKTLTFLLVFTFGVNFASNYFADFAFTSLKMSVTVLQIATLVHSAGNLVASRFWGYLADKYGNKPMLVLAGLGMLITPVPWLFCTPGYSNFNNVFIVCCHFFMGVIWSGVAVCQFNLLLASTNAEDRSSYMGVGMALQSLIGGISPILGGVLFSIIIEHVGPTPLEVSGAYKLLFMTTMGLRLAGVLMLFRVREKGARRIGETLRAIGRATPKGLLAMRKLGRSGDVETREEAIHTVGQSQTTLAADDVIRALHDPSPRVRRQAAATLSQLRPTDETCEALVHILDDHPDLVGEETIEALGSLGDIRAVPSLVHFLSSSRSVIRQSAAVALGQLGGPKAVEALTQTVEQSDDIDLKATCLQSLRNLGAKEAWRTIVHALADASLSVRDAAGEAIAELSIDQAAGALRNSISDHSIDPSSEVAYALGKVGRKEDAGTILDVAAQFESVITRGRCLLGVAHLFGIEQSYYRLLVLETKDRERLVLDRIRGDERTIAAFDKWIQGDEQGAIEHLCQTHSIKELELLKSHPVKGGFLLGVCLVHRI